MRAYLAVLKDSFREALASRVLWIVMLLSALTLAALAPLGLEELAGAYIARGEIVKTAALISTLKDAGRAAHETAAKRIWRRLSTPLQESLTAYPKPSAGGRPAFAVPEDLRDELNELLDAPDLYDAAAWKEAELSTEARELAAAGPLVLEKQRLRRLNRLLLEAALPSAISASSSHELVVSYLGNNLGSPTTARKEDIVKLVLLLFVSYIVGVVGVFAGILVTSPIVPQTFEPGAIDLLLSKPISRTLLYLTKFLGGCSFVLINAAFLLAGLWLLVGWRYGLWSQKLLVCIPLLVFLFAIYYSVSALAGLIWRNAVVSVVVTILFWATCFGVGAAKSGIELLFLNPTRLTTLVPAGERLFAVNEQGLVQQWDEASRSWQEAFAGSPERRFGRMGTRLAGPAFDPQKQMLLAIDPGRNAFDLTSGPKLLFATAKNDWARTEGISAPDGVVAAWIDRGKLHCVAASGVLRLEGDPTVEQPQLNVLGFNIPLPSGGARFDQIGPPLSLSGSASAAHDPQSGDVAIYDQPKLLLLQRDDKGKLRSRREQEMPFDQRGLTALAGGKLWLALADGRIMRLSPETFDVVQEFRPEGKSKPRFVRISPDGRYVAAVFHTGRLWLYDAKEDRERSSAIAGQGDISAAEFRADGSLLAVDRWTRVSEYRPDDIGVAKRLAPPQGMLETVYRYAINPLYTIFPKPGELDNLVNYLLSEEKTTSLGHDDDDLGAARLKLDIWGPVYSSLAFMAVALAIGCVYVHRGDF